MAPGGKIQLIKSCLRALLKDCSIYSASSDSVPTPQPQAEHYYSFTDRARIIVRALRKTPFSTFLFSVSGGNQFVSVLVCACVCAK